MTKTKKGGSKSQAYTENQEQKAKVQNQEQESNTNTILSKEYNRTRQRLSRRSFN